MSTFSFRRIARSVTPATKRSSLPSVAQRTALAEATGISAGRGAGQPLLGMVTAAASIYVLGSLLSASAWAAPSGGTVVAGNASIVQATPDTLNIVQGSNKAIINWQSFSIGAGETVNFQQPSSKSVTLNRVTGNDPSAIYGSLNANGTVMLVNPNGVVFGPSSRVDVGGLVASTANISDADFMAGNYRFAEASANKNARIVNQGDISIRDAGLAALVAPGVENSGVIKARLGKVALAGAETFTLDFQGDGLLSFDASSVVSQAPQGAEGKALVINSGSISADGGSIELSARAVKGVIDNVINTNGVVAANSIGSRNGKIVLSGGDNGGVAIAGTLSATGSAEAEVGGRVIATGNAISVGDNTLIDASGNAGGGQIAVGNDGTANGTWARESVTVAESATLKADALKKGDGGRVTVLADKTTRFAGKISAKGGAEGGDGGFAEVSSRDTIMLTGDVDLSAAKGKTGDLLIDPATLRITDNSSTSGDGTGNEVTRGWLENRAANANITLEADGLITIDKMASNLINLKTGTGNNFTLRSLKSDGIVFADANTEIRTQGGSINLEALGVGSTLSNIGKLTSNGGDISLVSNSGITLGNALNAGSGNITVQSVAASIGSLSDNAVLSGAKVSLLAATGNLGNATTALNTATSALVLQTGGHLNVANDGSLDSLSITSRHVLPNATNTYALSSDGLEFSMDDGNSYDLQRVVQDGLDFTFSGDRNVRLGTLDLGNGDLQLTSTNGSLLAGSDNLLRAASLRLSATGAIGANGQALNTESPSIQATALNGGLYLNNAGDLALSALATGRVDIATSGTLLLKSLSATNQAVSLNASAGDITTDSGIILDAGSLSLTATGAIGSAGNRLHSNATGFAANAGLGGVYADLKGSSATLDVISGNGAIDLTTAGNTNAVRLISSTSSPANGIKLEVAKGYLNLGDIDSGNLADVLLRLLGSGAVNSNNGTRVSGRRVTLDTASSSNVNVNTGAEFLDVQGSGAVTINQSGDVRVERLLSSTSNVNLTNVQGDTTLVSVSAKGSVNLNALDGSIFDDGNAATGITSGSSTSLSASLHLGTSADRLSTKAQQLYLTSGGDIYVGNGANLNTLYITNSHAIEGRANVLEVSSPFQKFDVSNDGNRYTLTNVDSALLNNFSFTGDQTLVVGQVRGGTSSSVALRATSGDILDDGNAQTRITGNNVTLTANNGSLGDATHALNVNTGSLSLNTAANLFLNSIADLSSLNLTSRHLDPEARYSYRLTAPSLVLDLTDATDGYRFNTLTDVTSLSFTFNGDRDLYLGDIDLTRGGYLNLTSSTGSIFDDGDATTRILANSLNLNANGSIGSSNTPLTLVAQSIYTTADNGDIDLVLAMPTNSTFNQTTFQAYAHRGDITLNALQGDLLLNTVYAQGDIRLNAVNGSMGYSNGTLQGASVTLNAKGSLGSASNMLRLNSAGLVTANTQGGDIALNNQNGIFRLGEIDAGSANLYLTGSGSLLDDGDTSTRVRGATITLDANGALGSADTALGLATGKLTASANGLMNLANQGSLTDLYLTGKGWPASINLVDGNIGRFDVSNTDGLYYLQDITANGKLNFGFTSNSYGIRVGHIDTKGGSASLTSASSNIITDGNETTAHIKAVSVALKAGGSIGASGDHNTLLLSGTRDLSLEANTNFYVTSDTRLTDLALTVNNSGATANQFAIAASDQTFDISDDGAYTHTLNNVSGSGLTHFSFTGKKNIAVGSVAANGSVSLSTSGGSRNAISQAAGSGINAGSVNLYAQNYSSDVTTRQIGASGAGNALKVATSNLKVGSTGSFYITNSGTLNSLDLTLRHNSSAADSPIYTYNLASSGLTFNVTDSVTTTTLTNVSRNGLNFSLDSDRAIAVGTVNTGSRSSGSASLTASGGQNTSTGMTPRISGGTITSGSVSLSAANYMGSVSTSTVTNNLAVSSAGNVSVANNGNLNSLSLTANYSGNGTSATYSITADNISQSTIGYNGSGIWGLSLDSFVANDLALTLSTNRTLSLGTVSISGNGSASLTSNGVIQGKTTSSKITADAVTLNGSSVGVYASNSPLLLTTSRLSGNVSGNLYVSNSGTGDLTLGNLTLSSGHIRNDASILYDGATIKATSLTLEAASGSIGSAASHMRLDVRNLSTITGRDLYVDGVSDFYNLNVTSNHADPGRQNVLQVTAPQLVFDIVDDGSRFVLSEVSDASGLDFTFSGDRDISVAQIDGQRGRSVSVNSTGGSLISNGATLNASQISLTARDSIGTNNDAFTTHALNLSVTAGRDIYVDNTLDLSALSFHNTQSGSNGASYRITSGPAFGSATPTLTFVANDDGSATYLDTVTDTTGLNFTGRTNGHNLVYGTLDTSPEDVTNGGSLTLISNTGILAKDANRHLTAANLSFITYNGAGIGADGSALKFSAPRLSLDVTGDYYLASDVHLDELTVNTQRQGGSTVSEYQLTAPDLTYSAVDTVNGTTLNITDTRGLRLNYYSGRSLVLGDIDLGETSVLNLNTQNGGANIVGDGDANHRITTGTLSLRAQGTIGADGAPVRAYAASANAYAYGGGVRLALSNPSALDGITATGHTYLENAEGDIALGNINLNGYNLYVTNYGGSIVSGSLTNVVNATLDAYGSIGNVSAITTTAQGQGTTTLTATARTNDRGAVGSIDLRESYNLTATSVTAPGGVSLYAGYGLIAGNINGGASDVSLTANRGNISGLNGSNLITGGNVTLSANYTNASEAYSIGTSGTRINVATLNLTLISPKDIYVSSNQALDSLVITRKNSNYTSGGTISVQASGLIASLSDNAISNLQANGLDFTFNANRALQIGTIDVGSTGNVTLSSAGYQRDGSITAANSSSLITAGSLTLEASNYYQSGVGYSAGSIGSTGQALRTNVGSINASAPGLINLDNQGSVQLDNLSAGGNLSVVTRNGGDILLGALAYGSGTSLSLKAAGSILAGSGSLSSSAGAIVLEAVNGIGTADAAVSIAAGSNNPVTAKVTGNGDIHLSTSNLSGGLTTETNGGDTYVESNGNVLLTSMTSAGGDISVSASGTLTAGDLNAGDGNVMLSANSILAQSAGKAIRGQGIDIVSTGFGGVGTSSLGLNTIGRKVTVSSQGGNIYLSPSEASTLAVVASNGGAIVVRAGNDLFLGNLLSSGGAIDASAQGNLYAGNINAGGGNVKLSGATIKADDAETSLIIGSQVALTAVSGIGDASRALQTRTNRLDAVVTGAGDLYLNDTNVAGLLLNNVRTQNGAIDIRSAGPLSAASITSSSDTVGNDIRLQNTSGSLLLGSLRAGDVNGKVVLVSAGDVGRLGNDATNVRGFDLSITANGNIGAVTDVMTGAVDALRTQVTAIHLDTGAQGDQVAISNSGTLVIGSPIQVPADGKIYLQTTGTLVADYVTAPANGDLALLAGGELHVRSNALSTTGNLRLEGGTDVLNVGTDQRTITAEAGSLRFVTGSQGGDTRLNSQTGNLYVNSGAHDLVIENQGQLSMVDVIGTGNIDFTNDSGFVANNFITSGTDKTLRLTAEDGDITILGAMAGNSSLSVELAANNGDVTLAQHAGGLKSLSIEATNISLMGATTNGGAQSYKGATRLGGTYMTNGGSFTIEGATHLTDSTAIVTGNGNVSLQTVDGGQELIIANGTGTVRFSDAVGASEALASLAVNGSGNLLLEDAITTVGTQRYNNVRLDGNSTLTSQNAGITFDGLVDGEHDLRLISGNAGDVAFLGALGSLERVGAVRIDTAGESYFGAAVRAASVYTDDPGHVRVSANVDTTGNQYYGERLVLNNDVVLTGGRVTLAQGADGPHGLSVVGDADVRGAIGADQALTSLSISGTAQLGGGLISTTGNQTYQGAVTLGADARLETAGGNVTFVSTLDGGHDLTIDSATGNVTFSAEVGGSERLGAISVVSDGTSRFAAPLKATSLETDAGGVLEIAAGPIDTTGMQRYGEHLTLSTNTVLKASEVILLAGVDASTEGAQSLTIEGDATLGAVGSQNALSTLSVTGDSTVKGGVITTGEQHYSQTLVIDADTVLKASKVTLTQGVGGVTAGGQSLRIEGNAVIGGEQGDTAPLASLTVVGTTDFTGGSLITTGEQLYQGAVTLSGDHTLSSTGGSLVFGSTLDSGNRSSLTLSAGEDIVVQGAVGGTSPLGALVIDAGDSIDFASNVHVSSVQQAAAGGLTRFGGELRADGADGIVLSGDGFVFEAGVTADQGVLTVHNSDAAGTIAFNGPILSKKDFTQTGGAHVYLPETITVSNGGIKLETVAEILSDKANFTTTGDIVMNGLYAPKTWLTLSSGTGALNIGLPSGNTTNRNLIQVARLSVPTAGSANLFGSIGIVGGRKAAREIDSKLTRAPYFINETPWGDNEMISQVIAVTVPKTAIPTTPSVTSLFIHTHSPLGMTPDALGAYASPKVLDVAEDFAPQAGTCVKGDENAPLLCGL
ncbi:two-partner secretion domain-containing protein [Stutzerimonas nitrititolerans]|uniref:two-partner secretion domain-containing protein n=1 Tax=Stutzerimonas nitrititolerans TaxID=2482751 RepID=UPI0015E3B993|nr:filamentous hemagglutinin N-terminal domain-containing protein [Stutzerimonas nitrititolerans]MBA1183943.1 filamentous hemagglutinin N-terminal domain-containing protein [Stutzerimonas stutzeri]